MASFIRIGAIRAINNKLIKTISNNHQKLSVSPLTRFINTSAKPPQASTTTASTNVTPVTTADTRNEEHDDGNSENWISWGMSEEDEWWDRFAIHSTFFCGVSVVMVFGGTLIAYMPDIREQDWSTREAYLELRRREDNGLPLIDINLVDPSKITLPTDDELGDTEIII